MMRWWSRVVVVVKRAVGLLRRRSEAPGSSTARAPGQGEAAAVVAAVSTPPRHEPVGRSAAGEGTTAPASTGKLRSGPAGNSGGGGASFPIEEECFPSQGVGVSSGGLSGGEPPLVAGLGPVSIDEPPSVAGPPPLMFRPRGLGGEEKANLIKRASEMQGEVEAFALLSVLAVLKPPASNLVRRDVR